jgi:REP element-mobilizing transposase RayT
MIMPYWQLFYHFIWTTKNRLPLLDEKTEPIIYGFLRSKAIGLGAVVFAIGGIYDHVHMVVSVPPRISIATFIGQVKGVASAKYNQGNFSEERFEWQKDYGVFSFDGKRLPYVVAYVNRQKEHHAQKTIIPVLERTATGDVKILRERSATYLTDYQDWLELMRNE